MGDNDDPLSSTLEDAHENIGDALTEKFLGLVSDMAKPCLTKAIDYTLLVGLLLLQYLRCEPASPEEIVSNVANNVTMDYTSLYSCSASADATSSLLVSSDNAFLNAFNIAAIVIGLCYGIFGGIFVWFHATRKADDIEIHPLTEKLYKCTDKILILDTALEIPISFFWAPIMTVFVWTFFTISVAGLIVLSRVYGRIMKGDENAKAVFNSSAILVALSLFKLTGEVSQYWVLYTASTSKESRDKYTTSIKEEAKKKTPKGDKKGRKLGK